MDIIHANRKLKVLLSDYFAQKRLSILEWLYFSKKRPENTNKNNSQLSAPLFPPPPPSWLDKNFNYYF